MSHRKELKVCFSLFVLFMLGFSIIVPAMFRWYFQHFNDNIHKKTSLHLDVVRNLNDIETALYIYQKSFTCYLQTSNDQCLFNMKEARQKALDRFTYLKDYNKSEFSSDWIEVADFEPQHAEKKLREMLSDYNSGQTAIKPGDFQSLFYLVRSCTKTYFLESVQRLKQNLALLVTPDTAMEQNFSVENEQNRVDLLFLGFTGLKDHYHSYFWNYSNSENRRFKELTDRYQIIIIAGFSIMGLFAVLLGLRALNLFTLEKQSKKEALALGTRDKVTGLFNFSSLKILLAQEVARSLRTKRPISLLMIRIESFDEVEKVEGMGAAERLIFQMSETLKRFCRAYDRLYKFDTKSFIVVFPETPPKVLNKLVSRFQSKISKKHFLINRGKTKLTPLTQIGAACFPPSGKTTEELLKACEQSLSRDFNASLIFSQNILNKTDLFEEAPVFSSQPVIDTKPLELVSEPEATSSENAETASHSPAIQEPTEKLTLPQIAAAKPEEIIEKKILENLSPTSTPETIGEEIPDVVAALSQDENELGIKAEGPIQLIHKNDEDIIMVDFDREKKDTAEKFSRKNRLKN